MTHTFLAGGKVEPFVIEESLDDGQKLELSTIRSEENGFVQKVVEGAIGGAAPLTKSFMHDGRAWKKLAPMHTTRVSPACSLVEMENGEVWRKSVSSTTTIWHHLLLIFST